MVGGARRRASGVRGIDDIGGYGFCGSEDSETSRQAFISLHDMMLAGARAAGAGVDAIPGCCGAMRGGGSSVDAAKVAPVGSVGLVQQHWLRFRDDPGRYQVEMIASNGRKESSSSSIDDSMISPSVLFIPARQLPR